MQFPIEYNIRILEYRNLIKEFEYVYFKYGKDLISLYDKKVECPEEIESSSPTWKDGAQLLDQERIITICGS